MARGDRFTATFKKPVYYRDFLLDFSLNPTTGNLTVVENEEAIKRSIRLLVLTQCGEVPGDSTIGSRVMSSLFDNDGNQNLAHQVAETVTEVIQNHEPRALRPRVELGDGPDLNSVSMTIYFTPINVPEEVSFSLILRRVR
jgi:phage baseplate assembly protein W